jgi:hypothetical protein
MPATLEELEAFHRFATARLNNGGGQLSLEQLLSEWLSRRDREEVNAALRQAIAEMRAGEGQPLGEAMEELRQELGLTHE